MTIGSALFRVTMHEKSNEKHPIGKIKYTLI